MNLFKSSVLCGMVMVSFMTSCTDVDITMPKGPKGDTGLSVSQGKRWQRREGWSECFRAVERHDCQR